MMRYLNKEAARLIRLGIEMAINMNWGALGLGAVVAFAIGWWIFGLLGAVILAIIVCILMGILTFK